MVKFISSLLATVLFTACLSSCAEKSNTNDSRELAITFGTAQAIAMVTSRAAQANVSSIDTYGVSCAVYASDKSYTDAACGSFWYDLAVDAKTGTTGYYWPGKRYKLSFYAYCPCNNCAVSLVSSRSSLGIPTYHYAMPESVENHVDFLTCDVLDHIGTSTAPIPLVFNHRLTNIRLSVYNQSEGDMVIRKIALHNLKSEGDFQGDQWILENATTSAYVSSGLIVSEEATEDITLSENQFFIIPQSISTGTNFIEVFTNENGTDKSYTFTTSSDLSFVMGKSYSLKLIIGNGRISLSSSIDIADMEPEVLGTIPSIGIENPSTENINGGHSCIISDWTI